MSSMRTESSRKFSEQLTALREVSIALSKAPSFDAMCRAAGFDLHLTKPISVTQPRQLLAA
jgi:hypothetical protein